MYRVKITPIIPIYEVYTGCFETEKEAWQWVDEHNDPFVDYEVEEIKDEQQE